MLRLRNLNARHGAAAVLQGVDLEVGAGETVALLGPNGAGKSTLLAAITGTIAQRDGAIFLHDENLLEKQSHDIVALGVRLVPEGRLVFAPFSVEDNLRLGAVRLQGDSRERFEYVYELFPRLLERRKQPAGTLSGGEQQMLAIGRALMSKPRLLLLDEPFLGLAPLVVAQIRAALDKLRESGLTMLIVEQKLDIALQFASRAYVLIKGTVVLEETTARLARRTDLADLYFSLATSSPASARSTA
ncbi:MAG TPA: ABC transporter ATP-binding protein [Burkholderiales bacterium]|jgi:branched-chain amino acid transport system ATP-binding protein|nr:ABC transporter ATP-binding protein [Burkholderiales bacterium]